MWNAETYEFFENERLTPAIDLVHKIPLANPKSILDIGCGSGLSVNALTKRFSCKNITGIDYSEEMLKSAKKRYPEFEWIQRDCNYSIEDLGTYDIVFSNAFLQWLPKETQKEFIANSPKNVNENGIFAIQIPDFNHMAIAGCIQKTMEEFFLDTNASPKEMYDNMTIHQYYDCISEAYDNVRAWKTLYYHQMNSFDDIIQFSKGAAFQSMMEIMTNEEFQLFCEKLKERITPFYPVQKNGVILYPMERMFFIATNAKKNL